MVTITFPDGSTKTYDAGVTAHTISSDISDGLARSIVAAKVNDAIVDTTRPITEDATITLLKTTDPEGLDVLRHSAAHLLAHAVQRLYPEAKPTIGPVVEHGFYYDFADLPVKEEDLAKIEQEMRKIIKEKHPIERSEHGSKEAAIKAYKSNPFKVEMIKEFDEGSSTYTQGDFHDLCRGPHVPNTGVFAKAGIKLDKIAGAYWRGNEKNPMLTRIYGLCFATKQELEEFLKLREEAEKRDHRKLGKEHELFLISPLVGSGLPIWLPKGNVVRDELMFFMRDEQLKRGYQLITTPHIGKSDLYATSGHLDHYKESMYPMMKVENEEYFLKPMNCPHHIMVYKLKKRSYRELPMRIAEFGTVYRYEQSGELSGLARVRGFTQDDAHIFCTPEQVYDEFGAVIDLIHHVFQTLGFEGFRIRFGTRTKGDEKYVGSDELWDRAEHDIERVLKEKGLDYTKEGGDAAFYGPKVDFVVKDVLGREWQLGTVQLDYNLPERFDLNYAGEEGEHRVVMIHRAPFGSLERFMSILIEHFAAKFPLWLSPVQARVITIADRHAPYAKDVVAGLREQGLRVELDDRTETTGKKIREAQLAQVNYILVVGDKELTDDSVNVRTRDGKVHGTKRWKELRDALVAEVAARQ